MGRKLKDLKGVVINNIEFLDYKGMDNNNKSLWWKNMNNCIYEKHKPSIVSVSVTHFLLIEDG